MYSSAYGGVVYCYDTKTGQVEWTYGNGGEGNCTDSGLEVPGPYPTFINAIGNGVVYLVTSEHTIETPLFKGALSRAINATTGQEIWTLNGYVGEFGGNSYAIADGYATWFNGLDNQIYSVGRGPSALTVSAPQTAVAQGSSLMISGTVMDVSAGTQQNEQAARFTNGVPVSSDRSMKDWMGYVYQQKPQPTNFTGVDVTVSVIDANGNYRVIGTATTDIYGKYNLAWTPDITGKFAVYATFAGSQGYWPSSSSTAFTVDAAPATATPQPTQAPTAADLYFIPAIAGLFVAIVVVIALIVLVLRKHP
jgi:outer membrane protein assembly factor BamB